MEILKSSDSLFLSFIISLVITVLLITSGAMLPLPNRYAFIARRKSQSNAHNRYENRIKKKLQVWDIILVISMAITLSLFILFIIKEFI